MTKIERKKRDEDFKRRLKPRLLWDSTKLGTYRRKVTHPLLKRAARRA